MIRALVLVSSVLLATACSVAPEPAPPVPPAAPTVTVTVTPTVVAPPPPTETTTAAPVTSTEVPPPATTVPPPSKYAGCVAPAGMTKLIDQDPSDSQSPWKIPAGGDHAEIWFSAPVKNGFNAEWLGYVQAGAVLWNQSPCLDVHVTQDACPAGKNCIPMFVDDGDGDDGNFNDVVKGGFTTGGDIHIAKTLSGTTNAAGCNERKNVTIHEMGHAVGLVHRKARVLMNGDTYGDICDFAGDKDKNGNINELQNLLFDYGRQIKR